MTKRIKGHNEESCGWFNHQDLKRFAHVWENLVEGGVMTISVYGLMIVRGYWRLYLGDDTHVR